MHSMLTVPCAGETRTVSLYPTFSDFAMTEKDGKKAALSGEYKVWFGVKETQQHGMGYAEALPLVAE